MILARMFLVGWIILIGAIVLNVLAGMLNLSTWYTFLQNMSVNSAGQALRALRWLDGLFLFVLYPLGLGGLAWAGLRFLSTVIR
ncbi:MULTISPECIES: hypothetical protein [Anaerolinea]|uniref:DUF7672 family protein n=1 Tax=Anaerolinea TaxID=233189 RepID=UPI00261A9253|nr:hypothetical protein [Anaerolinea thermophila]